MIFLYVLIAILILMLMITIHEFGHYIAGKIFKFRINEFSIGFGPKLFQRKSKNGELFSIRALPLGGYCSFYGEEDDTQNEKSTVEVFEEAIIDTAVEKDALNGARASASGAGGGEGYIPFNKQKPWKRIIVLLAGATFNLFSAFIFSFIYIIIVGYSVPVVSELYADPFTGDVYSSELRVGDRIVKADGRNVDVVNSFTELTQSVKTNESIVVTVQRGEQFVDVKLTRQKVLIKNDKDNIETYEIFGFKSSYEEIHPSFGESVASSFPFTFKMAGLILSSFGQLITGQIPVTDMTGPVGTVAAIASFAELDWRYILLFLPLIASNLAIFNIFPIPSLDGARIIFTVIEWIRGKPVDSKIEGYVHSIGMLLLLGFVIIIDVIGFASRFV